MKRTRKQGLTGVWLLVFVLLWAAGGGRKVQAADETVRQVVLGGVNSAVVKNDGSLWVWGEGPIGTGTSDAATVPVKVMDDVAQAELTKSFGSTVIAAIKTDGSLWMWSYYDESEGRVIFTPRHVMDNVAQVELGHNMIAAVKQDGTLWTWGRGGLGTLGTGSEEDEYDPVKILDNVVQVDTAVSVAGAVRRDGSLWMWGIDNRANLGNPEGDAGLSPVKVMDGVKQIALSGGGNGYAIKADGSLWAWGSNWGNVLGAGIDSDQIQPFQIMSNVKQVEGGNYGGCETCAVKNDGSLWMWGFDTNVLSPDVVPATSPKQIIASGVSQVTIGSDNYGVVKTDGSVWTWGVGSGGLLGDGVTDSGHIVKSPTKITLPSSVITMDKVSVSLDNTSVAYTGEEIKPKVTVQYEGKVLTEDMDYTVTYSNNKNVGTASVTVTGKGGFTGETTLTFSIVEAAEPTVLPEKNSTFSSGDIQFTVTKSAKKNGTVSVKKIEKKTASVTIPATVKKNGYTFKVTGIGAKAFYKNTKLQKIIIGKNVKTIGRQAFDGCRKLRRITFRTKVLKSIASKAFNRINKKAVIKVPAKKLSAYKRILRGKGLAKTVKITK